MQFVYTERLLTQFYIIRYYFHSIIIDCVHFIYCFIDITNLTSVVGPW